MIAIAATMNDQSRTHIPFSRNVRRAIGWTLIIVGIPLWILPVPLGLPLIVPGALLVVSGSPGARRRLVQFGRRFPTVWKNFHKFRKSP